MRRVERCARVSVAGSTIAPPPPTDAAAPVDAPPADDDAPAVDDSAPAATDAVVDDQDLYVIEPALLWTFAKGKVQATVAYQFLVRPDVSYDPLTPGDIVYGKLFLQF